MPSLVAKVFGTRNEREIKRLQPSVVSINALEVEIRALTDEQMRARTEEFRRIVRERLERLETDSEKEEAEKAVLNELLVPAFALVREAGRRAVNMRHFDVQLIGGMVLHQGKIAEMKTGEGKTLVATLAVYLNALAGKGVHVVTVNDYLARRDSEWMGRIYRLLGLSVGVIVHDLNDRERKAAYAADITYGTNNEFGFDYLRDNMKFDLADCVQRGHYFAIVDEVDSILIDEARTPLIISGPSEESTEKYYKIDRVIPQLERGEPPEGEKPATGDYFIDEKHRTATLTEEGIAKVERSLNVGNLYDIANMDLIHHVYQALRSHTLFKRDVDYVVKEERDEESGRVEKKVVIVDEFTGRLMPGRRWSDGLHQAVEAKEGVKIERETQTLATITFQNYFRMYDKLAGMTGTAETEATEFFNIYKLDVIVIPTNRPLIRLEHPDLVYRTEREKFNAVVEEIGQLAEAGRPVLVGTVSVEKSERLSSLLQKHKIRHVVLNAKYHEKEAEIVAQAGRMGSVTISTNMAGRGTDILLGGNPEQMARESLRKQGVNWELAPDQYEVAFQQFKAQCDAEHDQVVALGGLHIVGTERHEARRIDNQLRGRAGRQGDPGSSRFYLSLEDDLLRIFGGERMKNLMLRLGMTEGEAIESRLITKRIAAAQEQVEAQNFEARKHLLEYDDVMNKQREAVYGLRSELLAKQDQQEYLLDIVSGIVTEEMNAHCPRETRPEDWNTQALREAMRDRFGVDIETEGVDQAQSGFDELEQAIVDLLKRKYQDKETLLGSDAMRDFERIVMLQILDNNWKDHLLAMDHLKEGIGLRGYGQRDPLIEYKKESFALFQEMMDRIEEDTVKTLFLARVQTEEERQREAAEREREAMREFQREMERRKRKQQTELRFSGPEQSNGIEQVIRGDKVGRNDPCPCGSGKKYKKCHGASGA